MGAGDAKFLAAAAPYVAIGDLRFEARPAVGDVDVNEAFVMPRA